MKVISVYDSTPKNFPDPTSTSQNSLVGPKKAQNDPKKQKIKKWEKKKSFKLKVIILYESTPKNFSDPTPSHKIA